MNCFGLSKKIVYQNEEFNLLQAALNIDDGLDNLRYNNIVIATDADRWNAYSFAPAYFFPSVLSRP
ncbi:MAG: hypothetical protein R2764_06505 [Bacteroidales bacterium]